MKLRMGFVSNSSSSSFVIFTTKENFEEALSKVHPFVAAVAKSMFGNSRKFAGLDVLSASGYSDRDGNNNWDDFEVDYEGEIPEKYGNKDDGIDYFEAWYGFEKELRKNKEAVIEDGTDC